MVAPTHTNNPIESSQEDTNGQNQNDRMQKSLRDNLRAEALAKIRSAVSSNSALTNADETSMEQSLSEEELQKYYHSHEEKVRWLEQSTTRVIPQMLEDAKRRESDFLAKIQHAQSSKWISKANASRLIGQRLENSNMLWFQKKEFLVNKFPKYYAEWEQIHKERERAKKKAEMLGTASKNIPDVKALLADSFLDLPGLERKRIVNTALAAIAAHEKRRLVLYKKAKSTLEGISGTVLAPHKVSIWLRRIFESNADEELIEAFLDGRGSTPLNQLIHKWTIVKDDFDKVEKKRTGRPIVPGFHFVNLNTFLGWHYEARAAYVAEADTRINLYERTTRGIFLDIRRELDMKDWMSAEHLLESAEHMPLSIEEKEDLASMKRYLQTQKIESPQMSDEQTDTTDPHADMFAALAELRKIDGGMYDLYTKAIAKGPGAFSALGSLMYNRCWCRQNAVIDDDDEARLREKAKQETPEVIQHGHSRGHENNFVPGYGDDAIRDQDKGEWSSQVLHLSNDPGAQDAIVAKCEAQQNNYSFKYWTTLIPEGLSYSQHQYIVFNLNWRIKAGMRAGGPISVEKARLGNSTKNAETHYAMSA